MLFALTLASALLAAGLPRAARAQCFPAGSLAFRSPVTTAPGLSAQVVANNLTTPRGLALDGAGHVLLVERGLGVSAFAEGADGCAGWRRSLVVNNSAFTQGIQVVGTALYVSTSAQVLRYEYDAATRTVASGAPVVVVSGIPPDGELTTRPLLVTGSQLVVSCALNENIDPTARNASSGRSQLSVFTLPADGTAPSAPQDFFSGTLLAYGIRNPAGFAYHHADLVQAKLWVVDNGASIDNTTGLTPAFVNDNPADELDAVQGVPRVLAGTKPAPFFGFPDCTTLWNPNADPAGDPQYTNLSTGAQFSLLLEPERGDAWCRNRTNNKPPRLSFQAHSVPLDLKFYHGPHGQNVSDGLSASWAGDAFVSFHGSFNRAPPTGYAVVRVPFAGTQPVAPRKSASGYEVLVQAANLTSCPGTCIRPVGLGFDQAGKLFVSSDSSGELFVVTQNA